MRNLWGITIPFSEILQDRNWFSFAGFNANINSRLSNKEFKKTKKNIAKSRFSSGKIASFRFSHRSEQKALFAEAKQTPKPIYEFNICLRNCQGNVIQSIFIPDFQSIVFHTIWIKKVRIHVILFAFPIKTIKHMSLEADNSEQRKQKPDVPLYRNDGTVFCRTYLAFMVLWNFINLFSHSRVPGSQESQPSFQTCLFSNKLMCLPGWSTFEFGNLVSQDKSKASLNELAIYTVEPQRNPT